MEPPPEAGGGDTCPPPGINIPGLGVNCLDLSPGFPAGVRAQLLLPPPPSPRPLRPLCPLRPPRVPCSRRSAPPRLAVSKWGLGVPLDGPIHAPGWEGCPERGHVGAHVWLGCPSLLGTQEVCLVFLGLAPDGRKRQAEAAHREPGQDAPCWRPGRSGPGHQERLAPRRSRSLKGPWASRCPWAFPSP